MSRSFARPGQAGTEPAPLLLERERELDEIEGTLNDARQGRGSVLLLRGVPGIGKTALLREARTRAATAGMTAVHARASELEAETAWGMARVLGAPAVRGDRAAQEHALYWWAVDRAEEGSLLLALDDAQWADLQTLRFLVALSHRLDDLTLALLVCAREDCDGERAELLDRLALAPGARRLSPAPLSVEALGPLLAGVLGECPDEAFAAACHEASGGLPLLAQALAGELARREIEPSAARRGEVADVLPETVERWVALRLQALPGAATELARALAALGSGAELAPAAGVAGLELDAAAQLADALAVAGLLAPGRPLEFAHPLIESAVRDATPPARSAQLHAAAYRLLRTAGADAPALAQHLLRTEPAGDEQAIATLRAAATRAPEPQAALRLLERAARERAGGAPDVDLLEELGFARLATGADEAIVTLDDARALLEDPRRRAALDLRLALVRYERGEIRAARETVRRGLGEALDDSEELRVSLQAAEVTIARASSGEPPPAAEEALVADTRPGRTPVERLVLAHMAFLAANAGEPDHARVRELALRAIPAPTGAATLDEHDALALPLAAMALYYSDEFERVEEVLTHEIERAQARGHVMAFATASFFRGVPRFMSGRVVDAIDDWQGAIEAHEHGWAFALPSARGLRAVAAHERDDPDTARAMLELPGGDEPWSEHPTFPIVLAVRGYTETLAGRPLEGLELLLAAGRRQEELGAPNPSALHWQPEAAHAALAAGDADAARALAAESLRRARRFGAPRALGIALRAAGAAETGPRGITLLRESVAVLEGSAAQLELAHSLFALGARLRRSGRRRDALALLRRALDGADRCGALRLRRLVAEELRIAGARPRRARLTGADALTSSERRVAQLAADGLTNRQIAEALFVTRRTVETHLTHAYSKLDISSREELAGALAAD